MRSASFIRRARESAGMTQAELAASMGVSQPVIARLESSVANPTYTTLERALRATGHTLELTRRPAAPVPVDLHQLRERLAITPAERLRVFTVSQHNLAELRAKSRQQQ
jgi:predicted transcriptional regulator